MEICIDKVYDRIALIKNIRIIVPWDLKKTKNKVDDIDQGIKLTIDVPDERLIMFKTICNFTTESKRYNMEKHQFKPFDQVLVRDSNSGTWRANFYSNLDNTEDHVCISGIWNQCIPYNEETAHLLGTTKAYTPPQPKTYHVEWGIDSQMEQQDYTDEEFENFIKTAVLRNKDISNFKVTRICG